jgi:hypothetical protein
LEHCNPRWYQWLRKKARRVPSTLKPFNNLLNSSMKLTEKSISRLGSAREKMRKETHQKTLINSDPSLVLGQTIKINDYR